MSFLYHVIPEKIVGDTIYPLNLLKDRHPSAHTKHSKKYEKRQHIQELYIPQLQCYWGDVIHLAAIHPNQIIQKLIEAGGTTKNSFLYFEIDPLVLDPAKTIIYPNKPRQHPNVVTDVDFIPYDPHAIEQWSSFPDETFQYYKSKIASGGQPLLFLYIPHILYKGSINVKDLDVKRTT